MNVRTPYPMAPEEEELTNKRQELALLETELADSELHATEMRGELSAFERHYLRIVGIGYAELDEIEAQIAEMCARSKPSDREAQESAEEARQIASDSQSAIHGQSSEVQDEREPSPSLKALYRHIAKRIHPDLTTDPAERLRRQKLMAEANLAYGLGDEAGLRKILEDYELSPEVVLGEGAGAELVRAIRKISQIRNRIKQITAETEQLIQSDIYRLKVKVQEAERDGQDLLKNMADSVVARIAEARQRLRQVSESQGL